MQVAVPRPVDPVADSDPVEEMQDALARASVVDSAVPTGTQKPAEVDVLHPHIFACGDAADAFGAINAGHTAYYQVAGSSGCCVG